LCCRKHSEPWYFADDEIAVFEEKECLARPFFKSLQRTLTLPKCWQQVMLIQHFDAWGKLSAACVL